MRFLGKLLVGILASIGFTVVVSIAIGAWLAFEYGGDAAQPMAAVPGKMVVHVNLDEELSESPRRGFDGFNFRRSGMTHQNVLIAIRRAKADPRVVGLTASISGQAHGLAQIQDLRDVIADFRSSGKKAWVYSETIGEGGPATPAYYLASAFDGIWVQPSGNVGLAGIGIEQPFFKGLMDRLGVKANVIQRKEYKSAMENMTNSEISPANKEALSVLLGSIFEQMVAGIAERREVSADRVQQLIDRGPMMANEALDEKLIDHIGYLDEFDEAVDDEFAADEIVEIAEYAGFPPPPDTPKATKRVAVVHAIGEIFRGRDDDPFSSGEGIASETTAKAVRDAAEDEDIAAIILRIDSPGGSYVASDTIWREVVLAKEAKPVIVSMGNTAASGGYFIAMPADRIFAQPATITGSIGVIMGKLVFAGAFDKLDVNWERIAFGESAGTFSAVSEFTPAELSRLNEMIDATYADFTTKAAKGRNKEVADLEKSARGRVWTGADALQAGLVDELGGLTRAIDYTKEKLGVAEETVMLIPFPRPEDPWKAVLRAFEQGDLPFGLMSALRIIGETAAALAPLRSEARALTAGGMRAYTEPITVN
ncbi:MAG: signal peptide peptidase SppA [Alphaproteobacteria bacterium]|nr:signal peptide peptidase SppA [Alphaproteobacteria bacterium]